MKYDFESIIERKGKDAFAYDGIGKDPGRNPDAPKPGFDVISMWVADMNFATAPSVIDAISKRLAHPIFGYFDPAEPYYDAIKKWHADRYQVYDLEDEYIGYENSVIGGVMSALNILCSKGDKVFIHTPSYTGFRWSLHDSGYQMIESQLVKDENGVWRINFEDMEEKLSQNDVHTAIFCSPHNPTGRVWEQWEIERVMNLFEKYDIQVISDEIWADIIMPGHTHIPTQSINEDAKQRTIALYAPTKTFNLAGLIGSYHIIYNKRLRERVKKEGQLTHYNEMNILSMYALLGAYTKEGEEWRQELITTLQENINYAYDYIENKFHGLTAMKPQATYMLFVDCEEWCRKNGKTLDQLLKESWNVGVAIQDGRMFGQEWHIRMNLASPKVKIVEALERLEQYVFTK